MRVFGTAMLAAAVTLAATGVHAGDKLRPSVVNNDDLYEVEHEGRYYVFDDLWVYRDFLELGETPYRNTRIGAGPNGQTLVFGLRAQDKQKKEGIGSIGLYQGQLPPDTYFYGEIVREGRIYVFDDMEQMKLARETGEPPFRYTMIGAGPKGETVVYALTPDNKKNKPTTLIKRFNAKHL